MHACRDSGQSLRRGFGQFVRLVGEDAAVGVAQSHRVRAGFRRRAYAEESVVHVLLRAVVEVFRVKDDAPAVRRQKTHAVAYHAEVLLLCRVQHLFDVPYARLAEYAHGPRTRGEQLAQPLVILGGSVLAACRAESGKPRRGALLKELRVLRVGRRIAPLDEIYAYAGEQGEDLFLVREGVAYPCRLRAVAQSGVVKFQPHVIPLAEVCWWR